MPPIFHSTANTMVQDYLLSHGIGSFKLSGTQYDFGYYVGPGKTFLQADKEPPKTEPHQAVLSNGLGLEGK